MKPTIHIRIGASNDSVTVDGVTFDRSQMGRPDQRKLTRMLVESMRAVAYA